MKKSKIEYKFKLYAHAGVRRERSKATVDATFGCAKTIMLVGDTSTQVSSKRREQVLTKLNPVLASLGKDDFPDSGKQLFGDGFESCLKLRSETANTVADAKKPGK